MKRSDFITLLGGVAAWPIAARAQSVNRRPLVGYLVETTKEPHASRIAPFLEGMRDLGYVEGQNFEMLIGLATSTAHGCRRSRKSWYDSTLISSLPPIPLPYCW